MAQGKLKSKAKNSGLGKKGVQKSAGAVKRKVGTTKKGAKQILPKKISVQSVKKVTKSIQKGIHQNIEDVLAKRAHQLEEGKLFKCVANPPPKESKADKKGKKK